MTPRIAIVGGGISGLSAAYYLAKAGISNVLIEKQRRLGGVIRTECVDGCLIEGGPDSFLSAKPAALELIRELGLEGEVIGSNDHLRKTYIVKRGRMIEMPDGLQFLVPTRLAPIAATKLLSWPTKARMGIEWLRKPPRVPRKDCSVAQFVSEHYGSEAVEYLAEPLLAGVYGGSPEELGIASVLPRFVELEAKYGSLSKGMIAERGRGAKAAQPIFQTLKGGLGSLTEALTEAIAKQTSVTWGEAEALEREPSGGYRLRVAGDWMRVPGVALACPAHAAARLVGQIDPKLSGMLANVSYHSSTLVALGFDRAAFPKPPEGFGFLVPRRERRLVVACTFVGNKFSFRVPPNKIVLRCFIGGTIDLNNESLLASVADEVKCMVGLTGEPQFSRIYRWPLSMAQYTVGHREQVQLIEDRLRDLPGLYLAGNAYHGIGIPDCINNGKQLTKQIVN